MSNVIGWWRQTPPQRKNQYSQQQAHHCIRKIFNHSGKCLLNIIQRILHRPIQQRQILGGTAVVLETLQRRRTQIHLAQHITQPRGDFFAPLQRTTQHRHRHIRTQRKRCGEARQLLVVTTGVGSPGRLHAAAAGQPEHQAARGVAQCKSDVPEQRLVELIQATLAVMIVYRGNFFQHIRMRAYRSLPENHQRASQDIRAFHRDGDRHLLIKTSQIIVRPEADALATMHIHRIVDDDTAALGGVVFDDGRNHRRLFAQVHRQCGKTTRRIDHVSVCADACQRFFHAFEFADRHLELFAHAAVCARSARDQFHAAYAAGRQRDRAPCR